MRKLILVRGAPGSGKSTLLEKAGLKAQTLSTDTLRQIQASPVIGPTGRLIFDGSHDNVVFAKMWELMNQRMSRGELIAFDSTLGNQSDLNDMVRKAKEYNYEVLLIDLGETPLDLALKQNNQRVEPWVVPNEAVKKIHQRCDRQLECNDIQVFRPTADEILSGNQASINKIKDFINIPIKDLSKYKEVVHIGDLQGCLSVLIGKEPHKDGLLKNGFEEDKAYVFVGDIVDRGTENGALLRWILDNAAHKSNVFFLWGNHEDHLNRFANGLPAVSSEFRDSTLPQLKAENITSEEVRRFLDTVVEVFPYQWNGQKVLVSHAGISTVPNQLSAVPSFQWSRGIGYYEDPVDDQFERNAPDGWVQVHGHRNPQSKSVKASRNSYNLEDSVEYGGYLRSVTLSDRGWEPQEWQNLVFAPIRSRKSYFDKKRQSKQPVPEGHKPPKWINEAENIKVSDNLMKELNDHKGVKERTTESYPHVVSFNFTRNVFFDQSWDDLTVKARGLFVNSKTNEVVARGYDKFFNIGERSETKMDALINGGLSFPITLYVKENGYLGNLGFDKETNQLFYASKSTPEGPFAEWFKEIFEAEVPPAKRENLRRWLRDNEACMSFEVIDPEKDPHMIEYDKPSVVLLDIFHRNPDFKKLDFNHMRGVAERFGLKAKERAIKFDTPESFERWHEIVQNDLSWKFKNNHLEGFVIEDNKGYLVKIKLPYYSLWKSMRTVIQRLVSQKPVNEQRYKHPVEKAFVEWAKNQPLESLAEQSIIALRNRFEKDVEQDPEWYKIPWSFNKSEVKQNQTTKNHSIK